MREKHDEKKLLAAVRALSAQLDQFFGAKKPKRTPTPKKQMLDINGVLEIVPLSRTTIYRMEKDGTFPASHYISQNRRIWYLSEIERWLKSRSTENPRRKKRRKSR